MALAKTVKINITAHQNYQQEILELFQNAGFIQITDQQNAELEKPNLTESISALDYKIAGVKFCLDFLAGYDRTKKTLSQKINPRIEISIKQAELTVKKFDYEAKTKEIQELEKGMNEGQSIKDRLSAELLQITPWKKLNIIPGQKNQTRYSYKLIILNLAVYDDLIIRLEKVLPLTAVQKIDTDKNDVYLTVYFRLDQETTLNEIINEFGAKTEDLPELLELIPQRIKEIEKQLILTDNQLAALNQKTEKLAADQRELKITFDYLSWQREKMNNQIKALNTKYTFSLTGWIDETKIKILETEMEKITKNFVIEKMPITEEENIPIIFKNNWASSFEAVTGVYGAPLSHEPDPTPFLAPFFILFFALCLTDAGYGIVLALIAYLGLKILKPTKQGAKMFKVLMYGGIVTFFAGALVGGWFGIVIDDIKIDWLRNLLVGIRLIDPVKNPLTMLVFSLILGVIQILFGLGIGLWWKARNKNYQDAILDEGVWLCFLLSIIVWAMTKFGLFEFSAAVYLVYLGIGLIILTQGRKNKNPIMKILGGIISLYGLIGYVSDVLSYSRLLALGLATGIIAMVINLIAGLVIEMIPYLGYVIAFFILLGGHIFNLGINALGSFIHSSRLQFVEFFPKFMEGGGQVFDPFQKVSKYLRIKNN